MNNVKRNVSGINIQDSAIMVYGYELRRGEEYVGRRVMMIGVGLRGRRMEGRP